MSQQNKTKFQLKGVPRTFGDKDRADALQNLTGIVWLFMVGLCIAIIATPGDDFTIWKMLLLAAFSAAVIFINILNWTRFGNRLSPWYYSYPQLEAIAKANNLKMFSRRHEKYDKLYYPAIAQLGWRQCEEFGCEGAIGDIPVSIYTHSYRSKMLNYDIGRKWTMVMKVEMPKLMPHTFLQARNEVKSMKATSVARTFDDNQRVSLQNDLDNYFIFYTHRRTVTDALAIWSPQLLYNLRGINSQLNIETIGKYIYVYLNSENDEHIDVKKQMKFIEQVIDSIQRNLRVDFLKLPRKGSYPFLHSRPTGGLLIIGGKYFAFGWVALGYFVLNSTLRLFIEGDVRSEDFIWRLGLLIGSTVISAIFLIYSRSHYTKTKHKRGL